MNHASLCSGIGAADLAASWLGWTNVFQCELDDYCRSVLARHFPDTIRHEDLKEFDGSPYRGRVDILSAGYPCQPFSTAGKRRGTEDPRHLWPHVCRVIRELQPRWAVLENVVGHISLGLDAVLADLAAEGYTAWPHVLEALSFGACHHRARVFVVARRDDATHPDGGRGEEPRPDGTPADAPQPSSLGSGHVPGTRVWTTPPPPLTLCRRMDDGVPSGLDRGRRLTALGNAICPQVIHAVFCAIRKSDGDTT